MRVLVMVVPVLCMLGCFDDSGGTGTGGGDTEPNDTESTAEDLGAGGTRGISGTCEAVDAIDYWKITASGAGTATATISWDDASDDDIDLWLFTADLSVDAVDDAEPPGDSPASVSGTVSQSEVVYLEIYCFAGTPTYTGSISVP